MKFTLNVMRGETDLGLVVHGIKLSSDTMIDLDGFSVAHDIVEHINGIQGIGKITDEFMALGASWYVRGRFGEVRRNSLVDPRMAIAADIRGLMEDWIRGKELDESHIPSVKESEIDVEINTILQYTYLDRLTIDKRKVSKFSSLSKAFMRYGYEKAKRKYGPMGEFFANNLFFNIQREVENVHKTFKLQKGMLFVLKTKDDEVFIEEAIK